MPKSQLDWLGVASLWIGAVIMAIKAGNLPMIAGAPAWLAAHWWNYAPLVLVTVYLGVAVYRQLRPVSASDEPTSAKADAFSGAQLGDTRTAQMPDRNVLLSLQMAKDNARRVISRNSVRDAEIELPRMKAALLTAHKEFAIPLPPSGHGAVDDLELGRRILEKVLPFLHAGHLDEARAEADSFLNLLMD